MNSEIVMPFGRYKGQPLTACDTGYLHWVLHEAHNTSPALLAAVRAELDRRPAAPVTPASRPGAGTPTADQDQAHALRLVSDLLRAGVRVVARGEGAVHGHGPQAPALRGWLASRHRVIDALARRTRWDERGRPRVTLASTLLAGLRAQGIRARALPGYRLAFDPGPPEDSSLAQALAGVRAEAWFRLAVGLPGPEAMTQPAGPATRGPADPDRSPAPLAAPVDGPAIPPALTSEPAPGQRPDLEGLRDHCRRQEDRYRREAARWAGRRPLADRDDWAAQEYDRWRAGAATLARRWADRARVVEAVVRGEPEAAGPGREELAVHCRRQAGSQRRRHAAAAARWDGWATALDGTRGGRQAGVPG